VQRANFLSNNHRKKGITMETTVADSFAKTAQALADKAANKAQAGIRGAQESVKVGGNALSSKVGDIQDAAVPTIRKAAGRAQSTAQQSFDAIGDFAEQARDMAGSATDSIVSYTKNNPVKALAIAAASGAVLYAAIKAFRSYND
jgi:ElaB/YqjD/DUF883 family membrane-anchored ribosome-binding protein